MIYGMSPTTLESTNCANEANTTTFGIYVVKLLVNDELDFKRYVTVSREKRNE